MKRVIAVVVPAFRCENTIVAALDSINAQQRKADIVLIIMDEPNPAMEAVCRAHEVNAEIIVNPRNLGLAATRNIGFESARHRAEYICFFDADDILHPGFLAVALDEIESTPGADAVFGGFMEWHEGTPQPALPALRPDNTFVLESALETYLSNPGRFIHSFALLRTSSIAAVSVGGKINVERLRNNEDFEFFGRLFFRGTIIRIDDCCGLYRKSPDSQSSDQLQAWGFRIIATSLLYDWLNAHQAGNALLARVKSLEHSATRHLARLHWKGGERKTGARLLLESMTLPEWKSFAQLLVLLLGVQPLVQRIKENCTGISPRRISRKLWKSGGGR
jgi:glycosyltransferase involved in cell wall biosynthesis